MTGSRGAPYVPHPVLPFRKTPDDAAGVQPATALTYYPRLITELASRLWWWRLNSLSLKFSVTGDPSFTVERTFPLLRVMSDASPMIEKSLNLPGFSRLDPHATPLAGAFNYNGSYNEANWNGLGGALSMTASVILWGYGNLGLDPGMNKHATWYRGNNTLLPSFLLVGSISITTPGSATSLDVGSYPGPPVGAVETTGSLMATHGGGAVKFWNTQGGITASVGVTCGFGSTFERRSSGVDPIWSTSNVQLLPVFQFPI